MAQKQTLQSILNECDDFFSQDYLTPSTENKSSNEQIITANLESECIQLTNRFILHNFRDPYLYQPELPQDMLYQRIKSIESLFSQFEVLLQQKRVTQDRLQRAINDRQIYEQKCELLKQEIIKIQRQQYQFQLKAQEADAFVMQKSKSHADSIKQQSEFVSKTQTQLTKTQNQLKLAEKEIEKLKDQVAQKPRSSEEKLKREGNKEEKKIVWTCQLTAQQQKKIDEGELAKQQYLELHASLYQIIKDLVIDPLKGMNQELGHELISLLPDFNFDESLIDFDLNGDNSPEILVNVLNAIFTEFLSVSQILALSKALGIKTLSDLKQRIYKCVCEGAKEVGSIRNRTSKSGQRKTWVEQQNQ